MVVRCIHWLGTRFAFGTTSELRWAVESMQSIG